MYLTYTRKKPKPLVPRYETTQKRFTDRETEILDERLKIDIDLAEFIRRFRLSPRVIPVLSIPLSYNAERKLFEIIETPSLVTAKLYAEYLPSEPDPLTVRGFEYCRMDEYRNLYAHLKARAPDTNAVVELQTESEQFKNLRVAVAQGNGIANVSHVGSDNESTGRQSLSTKSFIYGFDGSYWQRLRCDSGRKILFVLPDRFKNYVEVTGIDTETLVFSLAVDRYKSKTFQVKNIGTNDLDVEIRGTLYDTEDEEVIVSYFTLSPNQSKVYSINDAWTYIKIYAKATIPGNPSDLRIKYQLLA